MTSEIYEKIKEIKDQISQLEKEKYILDIKNPNQADLKIKNLRNILSSIEKDMNEVLIIYEGLQKQEQLEVINEIKQLESEYKLQKKNIDEIDEKNTQKLNWYKARNNEISGYEAEKIIRKEYENQYHEVENHDEIINVIHKDVKEANQNLKIIGNSINKQGETIDNVKYIVQMTDNKMVKANKITNSLICNAKCMKCSLCFLIILLLILNVLLGTYIVLRKLNLL